MKSRRCQNGNNTQFGSIEYLKRQDWIIEGSQTLQSPNFKLLSSTIYNDLIYVLGVFQNRLITLNNVISTAVNGLILLKFDFEGKLVSNILLGGYSSYTYQERSNKMEVDSNGNIFIFLNLEGDLSVQGQDFNVSINNLTTLLLLRFDPTGTLTNFKELIISSDIEPITNMTINGNNEVYISFSYSQVINLGDFSQEGGNVNSVIGKYTNTLNLIFAKFFVTSGEVFITGLQAQGLDVYLCGYYTKDLVIEKNNLNLGENDTINCFVAKFTNDIFDWIYETNLDNNIFSQEKALNGIQFNVCVFLDLTLDSEGNVYLLGYFGNIDVEETSNNFDEILPFLLKLSTCGKFVWFLSFLGLFTPKGPNRISNLLFVGAWTIESNLEGEFYVSGFFSNQVTVSGSNTKIVNKSICQVEQLIIKYNNQGALNYVVSIPDNLPTDSKQNMTAHKNQVFVISNRIRPSSLNTINYNPVITAIS